MKTVKLKDKIFKESITTEEIQERISVLANEINQDYAAKQPVLIGVLNGAFRFLADLTTHLTVATQFTFVKLASYHGTIQSSGQIKELMGLDISLENQDVIIVEDIVDSGLTAKHLLEKIKSQNPQSIAFATLLFKKECLKFPLSLDYIGFNIPDDFVVGYGLDYDGLGRELNAIYQLVI